MSLLLQKKMFYDIAFLLFIAILIISILFAFLYYFSEAYDSKFRSEKVYNLYCSDRIYFTKFNRQKIKFVLDPKYEGLEVFDDYKLKALRKKIKNDDIDVNFYYKNLTRIEEIHKKMMTSFDPKPTFSLETNINKQFNYIITLKELLKKSEKFVFDQDKMIHKSIDDQQEKHLIKDTLKESVSKEPMLDDVKYLEPLNNDLTKKRKQSEKNLNFYLMNNFNVELLMELSELNGMTNNSIWYKGLKDMGSLIYFLEDSKLFQYTEDDRWPRALLFCKVFGKEKSIKQVADHIKPGSDVINKIYYGIFEEFIPSSKSVT
jgi:hypothetical protein